MRQYKVLSEQLKNELQRICCIRVVDDDLSLREAMKFVLELEGWKVQAYDSGEAFLIGDSPSIPGCVILDVRMSGMSGLQVQELMNERAIDLPIIFLTAHGDVDMAVMTMHNGAADFILKPIDNERLLKTIDTIVYENAQRFIGYIDQDEALRRLSKLTQRQYAIAHLIAQGLTNRQIAERLNIAVRTVEVHRAAVLQKLEIKTVGELAKLFNVSKQE